MYRKFFGFTKRPFVLSPDPEFLFLSRGHDLALTYLEYGLMHNVGFVALTGEVGAGKTTLLKYLLDRVKDSADIAVIFNTHVDPETLLEMLLKEFELQSASNSKSSRIDALYAYFIKQYSLGMRCVIIVDEAQNMPQETFEELRMLSNLETGSDLLVQIILVGQPQLRERLAQPALAQLTQRISVHYHLQPLSQEEVSKYMEHRVKLACYEGPAPLFLEEAIGHIGEVSKGIPRIINTLCDASLTYAFADECHQVTLDIVERVISDNELLQIFSAGNGEKQIKTESGSDSPSQVVASAHPPLDVSVSLAGMNSRLDALEMQVRLMGSSEHNKALDVLQEMLSKERGISLQYAQKIAFLTRKHQELQEDYKELKKSLDSPGSEERPRKRWRLFSGERG